MNRKLSKQFSAWLSGKPQWVKDIAQMPVVDTHEHMIPEKMLLSRSGSALAWVFSQYLPTDLVSVGMTKDTAEMFYQVNRLAGQGMDQDVLLRILKEHWANVRNSGYAQVVNRYFSLRFGLDEFDLNNVMAYDDAIRSECCAGIIDKLFGEAGITAIQNCPDHVTLYNDDDYPDNMFLDLRIDGICLPLVLPSLESAVGLEFDSFGKIEKWVDDAFENAVADPRTIAVKIGLAYSGSLDFKALPADELQRLKGISGNALRDALSSHAFKSWLVRTILEKAAQCKLPVKFHTGHYAGHIEPLKAISQNLVDLQPLIEEFSDTQFVIMHHCWPYGEAAAALAKTYANCIIDQCWLWAMNPSAGVRYTKEFLMSASSAKLFAFGGDYRNPECSVGHLDLALHGICTALYELVQEGWFSPDTAITCAENVLHKNQRRVFDMNNV